MYRVPVKVGDELDVTIEAVGEKGDGIAKKDGFILFVPGVRQGDKVRIRVTKVLKKVGFADVISKGSEQASEEGTEEAPEEAPEEIPEESAEDTEDFGDEEEAPEEEPAEEAPEENQE